MNVIVDKEKIDILANAISAKSGKPVTMTLNEMVSAVDGIETGGGGGGGITPTGNINITQAGVTDVTQYATATVPQGEVGLWDTYQYRTVTGASAGRKFDFTYSAGVVVGDSYGEPGFIEDLYVENKTVRFNAVAKNTTITPTESSQTIGGTNYMMEGAVTVNAIPSNYVGSGITQRSSSDMYENGNTVYAPSGYYAEQSSKTVSSGTVKTTNVVSVTPTISVSGTGLITATVNGGGTITPIDTAGYMDTSASVSVQASGTATEQMTLRTSGDLNANGATVTAPAGYYAAQASKSVQSGTVGNPTAAKGTVSNNSISVTPSVTVATGYVAGGTRVGTAVTVSASELVSGSQTITSNNTYDVTNLAEVVVNVSGGSSNLVQGTFSTGTSTGTTGSVTLSYSGTGYPIAAMVFVDGGAYNSSVSGWYNSVQRYAVGQWTYSKSVTTSTPTYATSGTQNQGVTTWIYKNSTSQATTYSRSSAMNTNVLTSSSTNATGAGATCVRFKGNGKTLNYYVASSSYGLLASTTYKYIVIYSS